jgi:hypothetical protein
MNIDNELIRAMQDCDTTKARVSNLYKKSEDLRGFRSWDLHTRDPSLKAAAESDCCNKEGDCRQGKGHRLYSRYWGPISTVVPIRAK